MPRLTSSSTESGRHWAKAGRFRNGQAASLCSVAARRRRARPQLIQRPFVLPATAPTDAAPGPSRTVRISQLVSDQHLRTVIIIGMPHLGMPDWRSHSKPLSDADVTDIVAWLAAQRQHPLSAQLNPQGGSQ